MFEDSIYIFQAPQPADPWDGILNTTYLDVSCYQGGLESDSEDCLFVNVYTPTVSIFVGNLKTNGFILCYFIVTCR